MLDSETAEKALTYLLAAFIAPRKVITGDGA